MDVFLALKKSIKPRKCYWFFPIWRLNFPLVFLNIHFMIFSTSNVQQRSYTGFRINVLTIISKNCDINTNAAAALVPISSLRGLAVQYISSTSPCSVICEPVDVPEGVLVIHVGTSSFGIQESVNPLPEMIALIFTHLLKWRMMTMHRKDINGPCGLTFLILRIAYLRG